jgi:cobalt-zinc-cadmium efflux system protein
LALDAVPKHINLEKVREFLLTQKGVENIHDLHIWAMSTTKVALTAHLIMPEGFSDKFISELQQKLEHEFGIGHTTLQIENEQIEKYCDTDC